MHGRDRLGPDARASASPLTPTIAEALYVGLITDTGRFMYENTGPARAPMAADLIEAGVDVARRLPAPLRGLPRAKLRLLARALVGAERFDDGALTIAQLQREDFGETGAEESYSEGIIDHLRAVEGTKVAALVRELLDGDGGRRKVSLRATDGDVDVSVIARAPGGGGHRGGRLHHRAAAEPSSSRSCASRSAAAALSPRAVVPDRRGRGRPAPTSRRA